MNAAHLIDDCAFVRRADGCGALAVVNRPALRHSRHRKSSEPARVPGGRELAHSDRPIGPADLNPGLRRMPGASPMMLREPLGDDSREIFDDEQ